MLTHDEQYYEIGDFSQFRDCYDGHGIRKHMVSTSLQWAADRPLADLVLLAWTAGYRVEFYFYA